MSVLHSISVPVSFDIHMYFHVYFLLVGKIILRTCNGEETVERTLYMCKAEAVLISKNADGI